MAVEFHPLPLDLFTPEQRPSLARMNVELRNLFALEGTIQTPLTVRRSDETVVRRSTQQVHITRITPAVISVVSGITFSVGTPNLTFGLTDVAGTTSIAVSVNSSIALFDTTAPADIAETAATGSATRAARRDHVHDHPDIVADLHSVYILADGTRAFTGNQDMGSNKLTGLSIGTASGDAMAHSLNVLNDLTTATGDYNMGAFGLTNVDDIIGESDETLELVSIIGDSSTAEAFRLNWDVNVADPNNTSRYISIGFTDNVDAYNEQIRFVKDGRVGVGGPGIEFGGTGLFKGTIGFAKNTVGRLTDGFAFADGGIRMILGDESSFTIDPDAWTVLDAFQYIFQNSKSTATQANSIFRFNSVTPKTAGEYITFENPVDTNVFAVYFDGATRVYGEWDILLYATMMGT